MNLEIIYKEIQGINESLKQLAVMTAENTKELTYHIKRTDLLERKVDQVDRDVVKVRGFFTISGWVLGIAATILLLYTRING